MLWYTVFAALVAAEWHRKAIGIPRDAVSIGETGHTILASDEFVSRIDSQGNILWRQVHANKNPTLEVGNFVYLLNSDGVLSAFNASSGAKEWAYGGVENFAVQDGKLPVIQSNSQYSTLRPSISGGHRYIVTHSGWEPIPSGFDAQLYACESMPMIRKGTGFYHLLNQTKATVNCTVSHKPSLSVSNQGVVSLGDQWSLHEGLSNATAACILTAMHATGATESWKQRVSRHSAFRRWSPILEKKLLVVGTGSGSLYGLDPASGEVAWAHHGAYLPGTLLIALGDRVLVGTVSYNILGQEVSPKPGSTCASYTFNSTKNTAQGFANGTLTWTWQQPGFEILGLTQRGEIPSATIAAQIGPTDYRYKYLNPNLVVILAANSTTTQIVLLDGVSGRHLETVMQPSRALPVCAVGENWVAYAIESKLYVLTLFETERPNTRESKPRESSFSDTLVPYLVRQAYEFDEPPTNLATVHTAEGTGSGVLVGLRNTLVFVSPVDISHPQLVSKQAALQGTTILASSPAEFESSVAVAAAGTDLFYTQVQPQGPFDQLPQNFSYNGVLLSVFILTFVAYQLSLSHMHAASQVPWA